ncbi:MAG: NIPSNAP family protein [Verrucomicrobia bacterium]|nr:NIPSNAP family protein [Verrucomicrobiota bacterium]
MKRRTFLKTTIAATSLAGLAKAITTKADDGAKPQYYEVRTYTVKSERQQKLVDNYWRNAAIPALNRLGIRPVGAFVEADAPEVTKIYVLIPYDSLDIFGSVPGRLAADTEYQNAGTEYFAVPKSDPAYTRFESDLLVAFDGQKKLEVPQAPSEGKSWLFELRTYESPSEAKGINKVEMFDHGEVELMHQVNLGPVFFGQALVGTQLPKLTYMVSSENADEHKKHWKAFFDAPVWKKLLGDPQYRDNVSRVSNTFLKRTPYSQI